MGFKSYIKQLDEEKSIVYSFGRWNPMTQSDAELWDFVTETAKKLRADSCVYTNSVMNSRKNPLSTLDKTEYMRKTINEATSISSEMKNTYQIAEALVEKGYTKIIFVVHDHQKNDFDTLKKNVKELSEGCSHLEIRPFKDKDTHQSELRDLAKDDNFDTFSKLLPDKLKQDARDLFTKTKQGLGI
ncbi:MAG: hypothetical protein J7L15_05985 [Clostridiales bacterium]|nr:hypothetical protein [Clostridiales bacterium]